MHLFCSPPLTLKAYDHGLAPKRKIDETEIVPYPVDVNHLLTEDTIKRFKQQPEVVVMFKDGPGYRPYDAPCDAGPPSRAPSPSPSPSPPPPPPPRTSAPPAVPEAVREEVVNSSSATDEDTDTELELESNDIFSSDEKPAAAAAAKKN